MLLKVSLVFFSFLLLNSIPFYEYTTVGFDESWGCSQFYVTISQDALVFPKSLCGLCGDLFSFLLSKCPRVKLLGDNTGFRITVLFFLIFSVLENSGFMHFVYFNSCLSQEGKSGTVTSSWPQAGVPNVV